MDGGDQEMEGVEGFFFNFLIPSMHRYPT